MHEPVEISKYMSHAERKGGTETVILKWEIPNIALDENDIVRNITKIIQ